MDASLASLAGVSAQGLINHSENIKQNARNRQNMRLQQQLEMENLQQAPVRMAEGYKAAGLNPASITGTGFSAPAVSTHPAEYSPVDYANPLIQALSVENAFKVQEAEAAKLDEETKGIAIENDIKNTQLNRLTAEDSTLAANLRDYFEVMKKRRPENAKFYDELIKKSFEQDFNAGTLRAMNSFEDKVQKTSDVELRLLDNDLMTKVRNKQIDDKSGIWQSIAKRPQDERIKMYGELSKISQEIDNLLVQKELTGEQISNTIANTKKAFIDMDKDYHTDFVGMIDNGDNFLATLYLLKDLASGFATGLGAGAGAGAAAGLTRNPGAAAGAKSGKSVVTKPGFPHPEGYRRY